MRSVRERGVQAQMKRAPVEQDRDQATPLANPLDALAVGRHCELEKDRNKITDKIVRVHSANTNPTMPQSSLYALLPYVFSWCFVCSLLLSSRLELCPRRRKKRLPHLRLPRLSVCRLSARRIDPSGRSPASLAPSRTSRFRSPTQQAWRPSHRRSRWRPPPVSATQHNATQRRNEREGAIRRKEGESGLLM